MLIYHVSRCRRGILLQSITQHHSDGRTKRDRRTNGFRAGLKMRRAKGVKDNRNESRSRKTQAAPPIDYEEALSLIKRCSEAKHVDEALEIIVNDACRLVGGRGGSIWLVGVDDPGRVVLRWTYRPEGPNQVGVSSYSNRRDNLGFYDGLTGWVFGRGESLCLRDITDEAEISSYSGLKWEDKYGGFRSAPDKSKQQHYMAVPIFSCRATRKVIGVLRLGATRSASPFKAEQLTLLQTYAGYLAGLLTSYVKTEEERTLIDRLFTVAGKSDLEMLLDETTRSVPVVMDGSYCSIFLRDEDGDFCLESTSAPNLARLTRRAAGSGGLKYNSGSGKTGYVGATGKTRRVSGNITSEAGKNTSDCESGAGVGAFLCSPIWSGSGTPDGVIRVVRELDIAHEFDANDERFLDSLGRSLHKFLSISGYFTKGLCFVIMPFRDELDGIYQTIVKPTVEDFDFICRREDEHASIGALQAGIVAHIANANFIVADVTGNNPNVYYELGIAHTLDKLVILISQNDAPSDLRHWKYIRYDDRAAHAARLRSELRLAIQEGITSNLIIGGQRSAHRR